MFCGNTISPHDKSVGVDGDGFITIQTQFGLFFDHRILRLFGEKLGWSTRLKNSRKLLKLNQQHTKGLVRKICQDRGEKKAMKQNEIDEIKLIQLTMLGD